MASLRKQLEQLKRQRALARRKRESGGVPVAALVGYTNAGKSTLLNILTASEVRAENRLFATLDPVTRRLRFPKQREITISDTVGFIRNLPRELAEAFRATLEELDKADLLIHVADASHPDLCAQIEAVNTVLEDLNLHQKPVILALNKADLLDPQERQAIQEGWPGAILVSGLNGFGLDRLLSRLEQRLFTEKIRPDPST